MTRPSVSAGFPPTSSPSGSGGTVLPCRCSLGTARLVVQDSEAVLDRVATLLEGFDLPPRNVEITLSLFLGSDQREESGGTEAARGVFSKEVRGVIETLGDFTKWTAYEPLGSRAVTGVEGGRVETQLSDEYRVIFTVNSVHESQGTVKFDSFALERVRIDAKGRRTTVSWSRGLARRYGRDQRRHRRGDAPPRLLAGIPFSVRVIQPHPGPNGRATRRFRPSAGPRKLWRARRRRTCRRRSARL